MWQIPLCRNNPEHSFCNELRLPRLDRFQRRMRCTSSSAHVRHRTLHGMVLVHAHQSGRSSPRDMACTDHWHSSLCDWCRYRPSMRAEQMRQPGSTNLPCSPSIPTLPLPLGMFHPHTARTWPVPHPPHTCPPNTASAQYLRSRMSARRGRPYSWQRDSSCPALSNGPVDTVEEQQHPAGSSVRECMVYTTSCLPSSESCQAHITSMWSRLDDALVTRATTRI